MDGQQLHSLHDASGTKTANLYLNLFQMSGELNYSISDTFTDFTETEVMIIRPKSVDVPPPTWSPSVPPLLSLWPTLHSGNPNNPHQDLGNDVKMGEVYLGEVPV